ncbi:FtsW/RodA/SpoVE family cell cycle protein [Agrococcus sp. SGAir0287]|uniref:FtsW/RodA/SpoVE family cell cycle protein n=1 Tax=Agrococcus sp. SGAir0287 TaxID=2070347 RepID=UPI0020C76451|nr:FtsW/RodA/SpoVE family cell cycle protein [Agrococcus sp. SGAir0287]
MTNALQTGMIQLRDATEAIRVRIRNPQKMRALELFLLVIAWAIAGGAMTLVQIGALETVDLTLLYLFGGLAAMTLVMHVVLRFVARDADPFLLPIATVLNGIGIAMIYRIDIARGDLGWDAAGIRQIVWAAVAMTAAIVVLLVIRNHRVLLRYRFTAMAVAFVLLLLPMLPGIGATINGAQVWIRVGSFSFQPGEIAKIALAVFFAGYLVTARDSLSIVGRKVLGLQLPRLRDLGPIAVVWAVCMMVLVVQGDLGTGLLYFGLFTVMLYVSTGRRSWIIIGLLLVVLAGGLLWLLTRGDAEWMQRLGIGVIVVTVLGILGSFAVMALQRWRSDGGIGWIVSSVLAAVLGVVAAIALLRLDPASLEGLGIGRVESRVDGWLRAFDQDVLDRTGGSFQLVTGIFGMAAGGLLGTGLGLGRPDLVPHAESDFIMASIGEELGMVGMFAVLALFLVLVSRGMRVGYLGSDDFTRLLAVGLAFVIALQVFIVVGGVTRVIPLTGLTTPFMAAGGSSLVANWIIVALLLRLSDTVRLQRRVVTS